MGLLTEELEKVPKNFTRRDCYRRIYEWHKKFGEQRIKEKYQREDAYSRAYGDLIKELPHPDEISEECMDFIFGEVIYMLMEWSYHEVDEFGIKIAAYAHFAINQKYEGIHDEEFQKNKEMCPLYKRFGYPNWKKQYEL
jgi:hypothetical protein